MDLIQHATELAEIASAATDDLLKAGIEKGYESNYRRCGGAIHGLGEIGYKALRYETRRDPDDLRKIIAWAVLISDDGDRRPLADNRLYMRNIACQRVRGVAAESDISVLHRLLAAMDNALDSTIADESIYDIENDLQRIIVAAARLIWLHERSSTV